MKIPSTAVLAALTVTAFFVLISLLMFLPGRDGSAADIVKPVIIEVPEEDFSAFKNISLDSLVYRLDGIGPINSILISQHNELIAEKYFRGMHARRANNIKSASKSVLSILTGIAIDQGYLEGVDQPIGEFFPEYFTGGREPEKAAITIADLLTMRAGMATTSGRSYGRWVTSNDWIRSALDRPMEGVPGVDRIYSTGTTHLLSVVLSRATGMSTLAFANKYLFGPMDIRVYGWDRDPLGYYLGGNNMALLPGDLLKIGRMMMDMGVYNGHQIVSPEWILQSIEPVTGRTDVNNYGYLWFRRMAGDHHVIYAWGNGGQFIKIIPELDVVIAVTSVNDTGVSRGYSRRLMEVVDNEIVPYLRYRGSRE